MTLTSLLFFFILFLACIVSGLAGCMTFRQVLQLL